MFEIIISILTLTLLELVLGIDNVIFISLVLEDLDGKRRKMLRMIGLAGAFVARIILLFSINYISHLNKHVLFNLFNLGFTWHNIIMLFGGGFLIYKSITELHEKYESLTSDDGKKKNTNSSVFAIVIQIILIDIVFSFDSILTAIGLSDQLFIMVTAVVLSMAVMLFFSEMVNKMIDKYPTIKNLALCFLIVVGFVLFLEGLHYEIPKHFIYVMIAFGLGVEILNITSGKKKIIDNFQVLQNDINRLTRDFEKLTEDEKKSILKQIDEWKSLQLTYKKYPKI